MPLHANTEQIRRAAFDALDLADKVNTGPKDMADVYLRLANAALIALAATVEALEGIRDELHRLNETADQGIEIRVPDEEQA